MKKLLLVALFACVAPFIKAESYIGGNIGYAMERVSSNGNSGTTNVFTIAPEGGHKFNDVWAIGASVGYTYLSDYDISKFTVLPYLRATFAHAGIVDFFGEIAAGYGYEFADGLDYGYGVKANYNVSSFIVGLRPGITVNTSDKFALQFRTTLFSYEHYDGANDIGFALNGNFELGFMFKF